uniref:Uncharacterized protein n=1 Tax=Rhizophora mucronata TaxID=61149 RepID=A0A2P2J1I3_RHIMU
MEKRVRKYEEGKIETEKPSF